MQEALLKAWHRRDDFRGEAALDSWIHRIALNAAIDLTGGARRAPKTSSTTTASWPRPRRRPRTSTRSEALGKDLSVAMQRLTTLERQVFLLKHIEGWRLDEIAESLQTNINNVKNTLFRAVRKLRVDLHVWRGES